MVVPTQIFELVWMEWDHFLAHLTKREQEVTYRLQARLAVVPVQIPVVDAVRLENWREMYADFVTSFAPRWDQPQVRKGPKSYDKAAHLNIFLQPLEHIHFPGTSSRADAPAFVAARFVVLNQAMV